MARLGLRWGLPGAWRVRVFAAAWLVGAHVGCSFLVSTDGLAGDPPLRDDGGASADAPAEDAGGSDAAPQDGSMRDAVALDSGCGGFSVPGASALSDDFSGGMLGPNWAANAACLQEVVGEMVAQPEANAANSYCLGSSKKTYHLTCDSITVKVAQTATSTVGAQTFIYVSQADGKKTLALYVENGGFGLGVSSGGSGPTPVSGTYDPAADLWWRLREAEGELTFETSSDGATWKLRAQTPDPIVFDDVGITLGAGAYRALPQPGVARFHCYNVPPPCF